MIKVRYAACANCIKIYLGFLNNEAQPEAASF